MQKKNVIVFFDRSAAFRYDRSTWESMRLKHKRGALILEERLKRRMAEAGEKELQIIKAPLRQTLGQRVVFEREEYL